MKRLFFVILCYFFFTATSFDNTNVVDCKYAMALFDSTVKNFKTFEGRFTHSYSSPDGKTMTVEEGNVFLKKGGKIKFVYSKPEGKIAVSNGKIAYLYLKEDNCAYKIRIPSGKKTPVLAKIIMGKTTPSREFFCAFARRENETLFLELGLKEKDLSLRRLEMGIDEKSGFFSSISYVDQYDQKIILNFFDGKSNTDIPDLFFEFSLPEGAKLLDSPEEFIDELNF